MGMALDKNQGWIQQLGGGGGVLGGQDPTILGDLQTS